MAERKHTVLKNLSQKLYSFHSSKTSPIKDSSLGIRIVCISDTHNSKPAVPAGDLLIHGGDFSNWGSYKEIQEQLDWLTSQPHKFKVVIAGNNDTFLDENYMSKHPEVHKDVLKKTLKDINWHDITYLQNSTTVLEFDKAHLKVYGSPQTPQFGLSAFQYPPKDDVWLNTVPDDTDIVITHGPPQFHLDTTRGKSVGCSHLAREIARVRPKLHVFGHVHSGYGREDDVVINDIRKIHDEISNGSSGWGALGSMLNKIIWERFSVDPSNNLKSSTTFVNASVVGGHPSMLKNEAIIVDI